MLSKLLLFVSLFFALKTPYPYILILGVLGVFFVWCGIFIKVKNGIVGWILYIFVLGALVMGVAEVHTNWRGADDARLDEKTVCVLGINRNGFLLDTGERIVPAGITMPARRHLRELVNCTMSFIGDNSVKLTWDNEMGGYLMTVRDSDISQFLVVHGYAKPNENASLTLHDLAESARQKKLGVWSRPLLMKPQAPWWLALKCYIDALWKCGVTTAAVLLGIWLYSVEVRVNEQR